MQAFLANGSVAKQGLLQSTYYADRLPIFQRYFNSIIPKSVNDEEYL